MKRKLEAEAEFFNASDENEIRGSGWKNIVVEADVMKIGHFHRFQYLRIFENGGLFSKIKEEKD